MRGVNSMIHFVTLCEFMLIPVPTPLVVNHEWADGEDASDYPAYYPEDIADYGARGWCRVEYFIFGLFSEMRAAAALRAADGLPTLQLFACGTSGELQQFKVVEFLGGARGDMPSQGAFSFASDQERVATLEASMISAFGHAAIRNAAAVCGTESTIVDLGAKMLRDEHMPTLRRCIEEGAFASATTLSLNSCPDVTHLPELHPGMGCLKTLSLINCTSLARLPRLDALPCLKSVKLENCPLLQELPALPDGVSWDDAQLPDHLKRCL